MNQLEKFFDYFQDIIDGFELQTTRQTYFAGKFSELNDKYVIDVTIPGFDRDEINLSVVVDYLHIDAEHKDKSLKSIPVKKIYLLPERANKDNIEAALKNGILTISIPKLVQNKSRKIEIK